MVDLAVHGSPIWGEGGQAQRLLDQWVPDIRLRAPATERFVIVPPIHLRGWAFWGKGLRLYLKQYLFGRFNAMETADTMTPVWEEICWSLEPLRTCYLQAAELGCESQCH